jgi:chorismate-pyruvate lyase
MVSLPSLIEVYYASPSTLGEFHRVSADDVPDPYRGLLAHRCHMTVTVEAFHGDSVDVTVLRSSYHERAYCREILLKTHCTGDVVQYGIVRLNMDLVAERPRDEILEERKPLGRVLIEHEVLREVELFDLFLVRCGPALAEFFGVEIGTLTYGRTALIYCDSEPAIELLEIVAPVSSRDAER